MFVPDHDWRERHGVSAIEVLVVIAILGLIVSLLMPAVQSARESARAVECRDRLREMGIAAQTYESSNRRFPFTSSAWTDIRTKPPRRHIAISPHRYLLAYLDPNVFEAIDFKDPTDPAWTNSLYPSFSPANDDLLAIELAPFACPSDDVPAGGTSYRANMGISSIVLPPGGTVEPTAQMGAFVNGRSVLTAEFLDGYSNTALFSERVVGDYAPSSYDPFRDVFARPHNVYGTDLIVEYCRQNATLTPAVEFSFAGGNWLLGGWLNTWYHHALPPNSKVPDWGDGPVALDGGHMLVTARSLHPGVVHVAMADGAVRIVAETIQGQVWRAVGTRNGREGEAISLE